MGGGADETDRAALDMREEDVLLGFVEAVDFIDEQDRGLPAEVAHGAGLIDLGADFADVGFHAVEGLEA